MCVPGLEQGTSGIKVKNLSVDRNRSVRVFAIFIRPNVAVLIGTEISEFITLEINN